mgnify:CR=1 FL=1
MVSLPRRDMCETMMKVDPAQLPGMMAMLWLKGQHKNRRVVEVLFSGE